MADSDTPRARTTIDEIADAHVDTMASLDPIEATGMGLDGYDHRLTDFSPDGVAARRDAAAATLATLAGAEAADDVDRVTLAAMRERLGLEIELADAGELTGQLNNIASPVQAMRDVFDLMPMQTADDWAVIADRLRALPAAMDSYITSLRATVAAGRAPARRQAEIGRTQALELAGDASFFTTTLPASVPAALRSDVAEQLTGPAAAAAAAYGMLARVLTEDVLPVAPAADGVGPERYALWSRHFLGATIDQRETYEWGRDELARIVDEQRRTAAEIGGDGTDVERAVELLDADPHRLLHGTDALREWMQHTADEAIAALADVHFDIPEPVRRIECRIAPTQSGGIYYTGPSDDFSRPGRMWWSVPAGVTEFGTWRERTTVYHEGVPGHHLQIAQTVYRRELLNRWRRLSCWVSGHGEGWALYAERLMADLGFLDDPGDRLGMLDGQRLRAARVVLDIGVHLGLPCPEEWGGGSWDYDRAWAFFSANAAMAEGFRRFEVDRYLGWPGQAPAYKVGQRLWEQIRDEAAADAAGRTEPFSLKDFHRRALDVGSVGLDVLREALVTR